MATTQSSRWSGCLCHDVRVRRSRCAQIVPIVVAPRIIRRVEAQGVRVPPVLPRRVSPKSGSSNGAQGTANDFKEAPEWVKFLLIFLTSSVVAFFEFAICKRAPFFWAPAFFLLSFILWRLGLREVGNSNVPARSPDRLFMLALTALIFLWEYTVKRVIVYAPWLTIVVAVLLSPSRQSMDYRERYLSEETLMRAEREYLNRVPVTPKESAAWFGRLLTCFWNPFVEPMLLKNAIVPLQEQVEAVAPQGWTLTLDSFSLGDVAPTLTGWQVFNNSQTGAVERVTADFSLDTSSLTMGLTGSGPFVGIFSVTLKGLSLKGKLQLMPFSSSRMLLFSFVQPPELDVKLNIRGRFIGQQSIPQFAFLRAALVSAFEKDFVEPDRGMIPLDYAPVVGDPLATTLRVKVCAVRGLSIADRVIHDSEDESKLESMQAAATDKQDGVAIEISNPLAAVLFQPQTLYMWLEEQAKVVQKQARGLTDSFVTRVAEAVPAQKAASIRLHLNVPSLLLQRTSKLAVIRNDGTAVVEQEFEFQLTAPSASLEMRLANERGFTLGTARLQVAHLPDGSTGFWGTAPKGGPIATRLAVQGAPWKAALEVQGTDEAHLDLECSTDGWQYSLDQSTPRQFRKGLRSVVAVQVLEGRGIVSKDFNGLSDPYVMVSYNKRDAITRTVWKSLNPVFGDVMLFQENRSMLARRMRLDVLDRDKSSITGDDACGWAYINLDLVAEGQVTEKWVQLRGVPSGDLRVRLLALSGTDDSNAVREEAIRSLESAHVTYTSDVLKCTVVKVEGLQLGARRRPCVVEVAYGRVIRCTDRQKPNTDLGTAEWDEDLRFRLKDDGDDSSGMLSITVKDAPGTGINLGGSIVGKASVDASIIFGELDKLRADAASDGANSSSRAHSKQLLPSKPSGGLSVKSQKKLSAKAQQVKVASQKGKNSTTTRTDIAEAWVPLQGAGSDARLLVRLQGALGERRELTRGPLEETARFTQQTLDNFKESSGASAGWINQLQAAGRKVVSQLFD